MERHDNLSAEERLLLLLCRYGVQGGDGSAIASAMDKVEEWQHFVWLANEHGIIALAWYYLKELRLDIRVPQQQRHYLRNSYIASLSRNTVIYKTCDTITAIAAEAGIRVVAVKGLLLERSIYGNRGLRQMNDIDIVVAEADAMRLHRLLTAKGYRALPFKSPVHSGMMLSASKHLPEIEINGLYTEIHYRLFDDKNNMLTRAMVAEATGIADGGSAMLSPPADIHFLYLLQHLRHHERKGESQLRLYNDIAMIMQRYGDSVTGERNRERAATAGLADEMRRVMYIVRRYITAEDINTAGGDTGDVAGTFLDFIRNPKEGGKNSEPEGLRRQVARVRGSTLNKVMYLTGMVFPSLTYMKYRFGLKSRFTAFLYYPVRWWQGLRKSGKHLSP